MIADVTTAGRFVEALARSELAGHRPYLEGLIRPAVDVLRSDTPSVTGSSRFGGSPDLPRGAEWPMHQRGPYRFLAQINFAEIPGSGLDLPASGLLSLFVADDLSGEGTTGLFWQDEGYVHARLIPPGADLAPLRPPESVNAGVATAIRFRPTIDIPYDEYQVERWPFDEHETEVYGVLRDSLHEGDDHLLGYPSHCSLAYDPTPGPGWRSLLTVYSDDDLQWVWHDGDALMIFVEQSRLQSGDFSCLKADAG
jgi:hypothetical protein